jgi:protein-disulfide isomerase
MGLEGPVTDASLERALKAADLEPEAIRARLDDPEITRRIDETSALARDLAISGTPTFVFESEMLRGYVPLKDMRAVVAELRPGD